MRATKSLSATGDAKANESNHARRDSARSQEPVLPKVDLQKANSSIPLGLFTGIPAFSEALHIGRPNIGDRERILQRVSEMLDRRWFTNDGPFVKEFEQRISEYVGVKHCIAMCNATVALENAIRALELKGGSHSLPIRSSPRLTRSSGRKLLLFSPIWIRQLIQSARRASSVLSPPGPVVSLACTYGAALCDVDALGHRSKAQSEGNVRRGPCLRLSVRAR